MKWNRAIVVGGTSGIGEAIVRQLEASGCAVAVVGRRSEKYPHDVTDVGAIPELFQRIASDLGGLDLFIYSAGLMHRVGPEEFNTERDLEMIDVNLGSAVAWINQAAIRFQGTKSGTILAIGSVAGDRGRKGQPAYNASKAGLATYMEAIRNRLSTLGVTVATVKPGPVNSPMTAGLNLKNPMTVDQAAAKILGKAENSGEHYLSPVHRIIFAIIRLVPGWLFRRIGPP